MHIMLPGVCDWRQLNYKQKYFLYPSRKTFTAMEELRNVKTKCKTWELKLQFQECLWVLLRTCHRPSLSLSLSFDVFTVLNLNHHLSVLSNMYMSYSKRSVLCLSQFVSPIYNSLCNSNILLYITFPCCTQRLYNEASYCTTFCTTMSDSDLDEEENLHRHWDRSAYSLCPALSTK